MPRSLAYLPTHALNAICPYYTMFPLEYPFNILRNYKAKSPVILDPFCGRGTTIYAGREFGHPAWGIDTSPIAVAIAKAKLASATIDSIIGLGERLINIPPQDVPRTKFFRDAYHKDTLVQLCSLREGLMNLRKNSNASILLRAAALGCLHGPLSKTESPSYFSNQMPRTFAAKPDYAVEFWKERKLKAPKVDVLAVLKKKLSLIARIDEPSTGIPGQIICANSELRGTYNKIADDFSLVITSPPYYGMRTYIQDQWLRMWFLGGPVHVDYDEATQVNHGSKQSFIESLANVWSNLYSSTSDQLDVFVRFGSVPSVKSDPIELINSSFEHSGGWRIVYTKNASTAEQGKRQANHMATASDATDEFDFHVVRT